jgi:hypothetical protein
MYLMLGYLQDLMLVKYFLLKTQSSHFSFFFVTRIGIAYQRQLLRERLLILLRILDWIW